MSIRKILVPTDFSDHATAAVEAAIDFAKAFDAELHLIHAYHLDVPPSFIAGHGAGYVNPQEVLEPIRKGSEAAIEALMKDVSSQVARVQSHIIMDHPSRAILAEAERIDADLIVMGTRGHTGIKHVVLGSVAERVVRLAPCPVVTVKAAA